MAADVTAATIAEKASSESRFSLFGVSSGEEDSMNRRWSALASVVTFYAALSGATAPATAAEDVAAFYRGKQLRFVVGSAVGGGYDLFARTVARHMVHHIPGSPTIIVQNQPAAGGVVMANQLYALGPKDGTVIGIPINGLPTAPLLQTGTQFDASKLIWLGSTNREAYVAFVWHTVPVDSITDLTKKEVLVGATTPGTTMVDFPLLLNDVLGYKFKLVRGYAGTPQVNIAIERGEVQGMGGIGWASVKVQTLNWITDKKIKILAQFGFKRYEDLPDVPTMFEFAKTDADRQAMRMLFARTEYGRPYFLPPDVPADRVEALRRAFDATMKDPAFLAEAVKLQLDVSPMTGEEVQALVGDLANTPPEVTQRVKAALEK
jgi:tripartite-type tricarboxylate transporter receptor subunit TctC